jgi:branched-chain amino acid transport system ATP-binding protein
LEKGEFVSLIGSNGAGKTTTLNTIIGMLSPTKGSITLRDQRIDRLPSTRIIDLGLALVPEVRAVFPQMNILDNLLVGAQARRAWNKRAATLDWVFQLFPRLKERKKQLAGTMSGGEQQMLNVARALMSRPDVLMLDEPSLGLAPKVVQAILDDLKRIHDEGVTILLAEQLVTHALRISDRAYVMETGKVVMGAPSQELLTDARVKTKYLGG